MLESIRQLFAPKVGLKAVLRGDITPESAMTLQVIIRSAGMKGWMRVISRNYVLIELEGQKQKIEMLLHTLQHTTLSNNPTTLEVTWRPSKNEFRDFHTAF